MIIILQTLDFELFAELAKTWDKLKGRRTVVLIEKKLLSFAVL